MNEGDTKESPRNEPELDLDGDSDDIFGDSHDLKAEDLFEILDGIKVDSFLPKFAFIVEHYKLS